MTFKLFKRHLCRAVCALLLVACFILIPMVSQAQPVTAQPQENQAQQQNIPTNNSQPAANLPPTQQAVRAVAAQAPIILPTGSTEAYTLQLFPIETVLRNPNGEAYSYVEINPGSTIAGNVVLDLWYSYSPITIPDISTMTVSVNDVPVTSRILRIDQMARSSWQVQIPAMYFRPGTNSISISVVHRTIDGLCRDIDNDANWFIIRPETRLSFELSRDPYTLASFPRPFLDDYLAAKINTVIYVPEDFDKATLNALLDLATGLGRRGLSAALPRRMEVRIGEPGQVAANEIVFGKNAKWFPEQTFPDDAPILTFSNLDNGFSRLLITGNDSKSLTKAVMALSRPQMVSTFLSRQISLASALPAEQPSPANAFRDKKDVFTLADLGYTQDIPVAGAFHQDAFITVPRPANYKAGDGSYIELHFRHSKILDPKKSAVTIYVNNIPVKAVALMPENAENGILRAPIPVSELSEPSWMIRFGFYHDLGIIDCSKRYDEVAWSVIEKDTTIYLKPGRIAYYPGLQNFPNDFNVSSGNQVNLNMLMMDKPTPEELTAAFKLAYYIGVNNQGRIKWDVQFSDTFDAKKVNGTIIALGKNDDVTQWNLLKEYIPISPNAQGSYDVAKWVETVPDVLKVFDICQIGKVNDEVLVYAFMFNSSERLNALLNLALQRGNPLSGQVSLVDAQGNVKSFINTPEITETPLVWLDLILDSLGGTTGIYIAALLAVLIATGVVMYSTRKKS